MGSPEDREKHRRRIKAKITRDIDRVRKKKLTDEEKKRIEVRKLTHFDLVKLIQRGEDI